MAYSTISLYDETLVIRQEDNDVLVDIVKSVAGVDLWSAYDQYEQWKHDDERYNGNYYERFNKVYRDYLNAVGASEGHLILRGMTVEDVIDGFGGKLALWRVPAKPATGRGLHIYRPAITLSFNEPGFNPNEYGGVYLSDGGSFQSGAYFSLPYNRLAKAIVLW